MLLFISCFQLQKISRWFYFFLVCLCWFSVHFLSFSSSSSCILLINSQASEYERIFFRFYFSSHFFFSSFFVLPTAITVLAHIHTFNDGQYTHSPTYAQSLEKDEIKKKWKRFKKNQMQKCCTAQTLEFSSRSPKQSVETIFFFCFRNLISSFAIQHNICVLCVL